MEIANFGVFSSSYPRDADPGGPHGVYPPGRNIASSLVERIRSRGVDATEPDLHGSYGWYFTFDIDSTPMWAMLQESEPWLVIVECWRTLRDRLRFDRRREQHQVAVDLVNDAIASDPELQVIRWCTRQQYDRGTQA